MFAKRICFLFFLLVLVPHLSAKKMANQARNFVIATASYNNEKWALKYLQSVFSQDYNNFRVMYYDDGSTDRTLEIVTKFVEENQLKDKITILHNDKRVGPHENYYHMIHSCRDDEIVVVVDGDDHLSHKNVLSYLAKVYRDPKVWITYGQYKIYPSGLLGCSRQIPPHIIKNNSIRSYKWVTSHLRTFYVWLYKKIKLNDLMFDGKFVKRCGDLAIMFPMIEMAGEHSRFIPEILYIYNRANENNYGAPLGDAFVSFDERCVINNELRTNRSKYQPLYLDNNTIAMLCGFAK
jgi:glycosyltransferase involved in cell wall biosynthesis